MKKEWKNVNFKIKKKNPERRIKQWLKEMFRNDSLKNKKGTMSDCLKEIIWNFGVNERNVNNFL